jgi:hypothetical protein
MYKYLAEDLFVERVIKAQICGSKNATLLYDYLENTLDGMYVYDEDDLRERFLEVTYDDLRKLYDEHLTSVPDTEIVDLLQSLALAIVLSPTTEPPLLIERVM